MNFISTFAGSTPFAFIKAGKRDRAAAVAPMPTLLPTRSSGDRMPFSAFANIDTGCWARWVPIIFSGIPSIRLFIIVLASAMPKSSRPRATSLQDSREPLPALISTSSPFRAQKPFSLPVKYPQYSPLGRKSRRSETFFTFAAASAFRHPRPAIPSPRDPSIWSASRRFTSGPHILAPPFQRLSYFLSARELIDLHTQPAALRPARPARAGRERHQAVHLRP